MNPIALSMDLLLAILLAAALVTGFRLNRRLEALKASHADFAKAVSELDAAALKADNALKGLRAASEEAHDALLTRIETARGLILKLEKASEDASKTVLLADQAAARTSPSFASTRASRGTDLRSDFRDAPRAEGALDARSGKALPRAAPGQALGGSSRPPQAEDKGARARPSPIADLLVDPALRPDRLGGGTPGPLTGRRSPPERPRVAAGSPAPDLGAALPRPPPPRRRAAADEDLFETVADGVRPGLAGLMRMSLSRRP